MSAATSLSFSLPFQTYLTVGVDTEIPWPIEERIVSYGGRDFRLLPGSDVLSKMVRAEFEPNTPEIDAKRLMLEFLSALAWSAQCGATVTIATWATAPIPVGNGPYGSIGNGTLSDLPASVDPRAKLALALYREGLSVNTLPYQFLGFFKVVNMLAPTPDQQMKWINDHLQHVTQQPAKARLAEIRAERRDVAKYLYVSGRCAVSHAYSQPIVNPDDPADLARIDSDLPLMQELARIALEHEFHVTLF